MGEQVGQSSEPAPQFVAVIGRLVTSEELQAATGDVPVCGPGQIVVIVPRSVLLDALRDME